MFPLAARLIVVATLSLANPARAAKRPKPPPPNVVLFQINTKETMTLKPGRPPKGFQRRFDRFLRCHHTNKTHAMNPRLVRLLYQTGRHWPGRRVEVISGYRHPTVAKNPHSPHMKGLACDIHVAGVTNQELRDYLRKSFQKVGVGYYPNSSFVHLDVRKDRSAFWIDYSGPGERAMYSEKPGDDLKSGRADQVHPTKIGADWANDGDGQNGEESAGTSDGVDRHPGEAPPAPSAAPAPAASAVTPPAASDPAPP
jgi:uncharacterized protein YcbK (DUF882 family)